MRVCGGCEAVVPEELPDQNVGMLYLCYVVSYYMERSLL